MTPRENPPQRPLIWLTAIGFEFSGMVIGGVALGWWLDGYFQTAPWLIVAGMLCGSIGAFIRLIQLLRAKDSDTTKDQR